MRIYTSDVNHEPTIDNCLQHFSNPVGRVVIKNKQTHILNEKPITAQEKLMQKGRKVLETFSSEFLFVRMESV